MQVPELIIAGGADDVSGTARPYGYFKKYREKGAPWVFVVQNGSPHCCTANAKDLILNWLKAMLKHSIRRGDISGKINQHAGWFAFIKTKQTETTDSFGLKTFDVTAAKIEKVSARKKASREWKPAGWLPIHNLAKEWLNFVTQKRHPILPLR